MATHLFIDNSFLFVEGYKHAKNATGNQTAVKPMLDYIKLGISKNDICWA